MTRTTNQQSWMPGPYQAPEVCVNDGADFRSNIWSFGCILVRLLSSKLDGARGLMWLDELRYKDVDKVSAYEHDYFYRGDPPNLNPHIKEWINNLPRRTGGYNEEFLSCCRGFLLSTLKVDKYERSSAESVARQLQQLTKLLMPRPGPLFDPEVYSNDSVYDESSRHLLHTSGISGQVVTEDPTFCGYTPGPQPVTGSKSASECCPHNPNHKAHVAQPVDRWDWVEKLQTFGYNTQEINDILLERARDAPWIYFEPEKFRLPRMSTTQHIPRCCHCLGERRQQGSTSDSMDTLQPSIDLAVDSHETVRQVEELCGLCGISPKTRITTDWLGSASFNEDNTAIAVTYSLPTDKCRETSASTIMGRIFGALKGFYDAASLLQWKGLCCDSFTVIRHGGWSSEVDGVAAGEVVSLGFHLVANLAQALEQSMGTNTPSPHQILSASSAILGLISPEFEVAHDRSDMAVTPREAARLPISGTTALTLMDVADIRPCDRVLINAPCGGIGHLVTQLVSHIVAEEGRIVGRCSAASFDVGKALGCNDVMPYNNSGDSSTTTATTTELCGEEPFDKIVDARGSQGLWYSSPGILRFGVDHTYTSVGPVLESYTYLGMFACLLKMGFNRFLPVWAGGADRKYQQVTAMVNPDKLERLRKICEAGQLGVLIGDTWSFEDAVQVGHDLY
ncbi:hypothetical protein BDV39DRAFT_199418 [Aspergillus sergii]|uniref:Protein kinase domain-containing protein n=1 Tax=Aspergillus sergii TaxID=1034303 RepID=A0A5N6XL49_9EURO|nr:hypothetical protein BDV39DRAFT_199418 [Aspergillus sergii]